jgi:hypothetical protein
MTALSGYRSDGRSLSEGHPVEAGQARVQMSTHERWWGYRWPIKVKFQPGSPCGRLLGK